MKSRGNASVEEEEATAAVDDARVVVEWEVTEVCFMEAAIRVAAISGFKLEIASTAAVEHAGED